MSYTGEMVIRGSARVACPACGAQHDGTLVQTINTQTNPKDKERLLAGELNVIDCACGKRAQLAANVLFHDPDKHYYCQVVPGGERAMEEAAAAFAARVGKTKATSHRETSLSLLRRRLQGISRAACQGRGWR